MCYEGVFISKVKETKKKNIKKYKNKKERKQIKTNKKEEKQIKTNKKEGKQIKKCGICHTFLLFLIVLFVHGFYQNAKRRLE